MRLRRYGVPPDVSRAVKARLGPLYDDLVAVMVDLGVPPIFLFGDDRPRLIEVRSKAVASIEEWIRTEPLGGYSGRSTADCLAAGRLSGVIAGGRVVA